MHINLRDKEATAGARSRGPTILPLLIAAFLSAAGLAACDRSGAPALPVVSVSKINAANYDKIQLGMSKAQVETILGPATTAETKDMVVFKKTTYRYEEGDKFVLIGFKNDEVDSKDGNLAAQR